MIERLGVFGRLGTHRFGRPARHTDSTKMYGGLTLSGSGEMDVKASNSKLCEL